jgi:hypothetical protein
MGINIVFAQAQIEEVEIGDRDSCQHTGEGFSTLSELCCCSCVSGGVGLSAVRDNTKTKTFTTLL